MAERVPGSGREQLGRVGDAEGLARRFAARLAGSDGLRRALEAWALARDTLEGTMTAQAVPEGACHKGCAWCCNFHVEVRFADAVHLARRARAVPALEAKVRATALRVGGLDPVARLRLGVPCAFLDPASGACSVYEDRPIPCRAYRSHDADWCRSLVGTSAERLERNAAVKEGLAIRSLVTQAMAAVTPAPWRERGELHRMVVTILDRIPAGGTGRD